MQSNPKRPAGASAADLDRAQTPFWFLNDELQPDELRRQLALMRSKGVKNAILHARSGFVGDYLDDKWFSDIGAILEDKQQHDEKVWLYDEFNWPSGTCNQTVTLDENLREQYLTFTRLPLAAGESYRRTRFSTGAVSIGAFAQEAQQPQDLLADAGFIVEYTASQPAEVVEVRVNIDPYRNHGAESVNYLDERATKAFIRRTHEQYYKRFPDAFGKTVEAFFNDEPRLCNAYPWCDDFADVFRQRNGYDLLPLLPCLAQPGDFAGRVRCDYFDTVAHLYQTRYFGVLQQWCESHGVASAAHLLGEETVAAQVRFCGDYMRQTRCLTWPGIDHLGKGIGGLNAKFGASAARNYGKDNYNCEVYAGCGWDMTYEEFVRIASWLTQQGVQTIINHGFFYSDREERARDWPPSQFFQWKEWDKMKQYNAMLRRLRGILSGGRWECETLIYHPTESFWLHYQPDTGFKHGFFNYGPVIADDRAAFIDKQLQLLYCGLQDENLDYNLMNGDAAENFEVKDGCIHNRLNGEEYPVLVLPMAEVLPLAVAQLAQELAKQGGSVLALDCLSRYALRRQDDEALRDIFAEMEQQGQLQLLPVEELGAVAEAIRRQAPPPVRIVKGPARGRHTSPYYGPVMADPYLHGAAHTNGMVLPPSAPGGEDLEGVAFTRYRKEGQRICFFVNYDATPHEMEVLLPGRGVPQLLDSLTGETLAAATVAEAEGQCVAFTLPCGHGVLLMQPDC